MNMSRTIRMTLAWSALALGCSAPAQEQQTPAQDEGASTILSGMRSPFKSGAYDGEHGVLSIYVLKTGTQKAAFTWQKESGPASKAPSCGASVDVRDDEYHVDDSGDCSLSLKETAQEGTILVEGTMGKNAAVSARVTLRKDGALVGKYRGTTTEVEIHASQKGKLTFSLTYQGREIATRQIADWSRSLGGFLHDTYDAVIAAWANALGGASTEPPYRAEFPGCKYVNFVIKGRRGNSYVLSVDGVCGDQKLTDTVVEY